MTNNLQSLIDAVFEETKRQENKRAEYISLVHGLLDNTIRKSRNGNKNERISFKYFYDRIGVKKVSFSSDIFSDNMTLGELDEANKSIDNCINTIYDFGEPILDRFIEHLVKVAIPQFLQGRTPNNYFVFYGR